MEALSVTPCKKVQPCLNSKCWVYCENRMIEMWLWISLGFLTNLNSENMLEDLHLSQFSYYMLFPKSSMKVFLNRLTVLCGQVLPPGNLLSQSNHVSTWPRLSGNMLSIWYVDGLGLANYSPMLSMEIFFRRQIPLTKVLDTGHTRIIPSRKACPLTRAHAYSCCLTQVKQFPPCSR